MYNKKCESCGNICPAPMADGDDYEYKGQTYDLTICPACDRQYSWKAYDEAAEKRRIAMNGRMHEDINEIAEMISEEPI